MQSKASLPQYDMDISSREKDIFEGQEKYQYTYGYESLEGVAMLKGIPKSEMPKLTWWFKAGRVVLKLLENRFEYIADKNIILKIISTGISIVKLLFSLIFRGNKEKVLENVALEFKKKKNYESHANISDYKKYFKKLSLPSVAHDFQQDSSFSKMRVAGLNPVVIKAYKEVDSNFPVTNEIFTSLEGFEDDNLENALEEGRVFMADYVALKDVENGVYKSVQKYSYAPKALFALKVSNKSESLQPIAIQCEQNSTENTPLFTPNDGEVWEIAKSIVQIADFNHHELITHLGATHLLIEPFVVTTHRQLAKNHPLYILLIPHFQGTAFINYSAQKRLVNDDGPFDQLFSGTMPTNRAVVGQRLSESFNDAMLRADLKSRGVENNKLIYPYRDDALEIWDAIEVWVSEYLNIYYKKDEDVLEDKELQDWTKELVTKGKVQGFGDNNANEITTLVYLKQVITMLIFTSSAQHSAVNFTQQSYPGFTPNMPAAGYRPIPEDKNKTQKDWLDLIAPLNVADDQTDLMFTLSGVHYTVLGNYSFRYFKDQRVTEAMKKFKLELQRVEEKINKRNIEDKENKYTYMLPSGIPQSINI